MSRSRKAVVVFSTIDSEKKAKALAKALVQKKLVACVNIVGHVTSIYEWKGETCEEEEWLLVMKTASHCLKELKSALKELHSYDIPELVVCPVIDGLPDYLRWLFGNTGIEKNSP